MSASTISDLNQKCYVNIKALRQRLIEEDYPNVYVDGISLKRSWGGEVRNISVLVAIGVSRDGYSEVLGVAEGIREGK